MITVMPIDQGETRLVADLSHLAYISNKEIHYFNYCLETEISAFNKYSRFWKNRRNSSPP